MNDELTQCPECGASWVDGQTCRDAFEQMLYWEAEFPPLGTVSRAVNFIALMVAACAFSRAAWRLTENLLLGTVMFAITTLGLETLLASVSGMESPIFVMLTALVLLLCIEHYWTLAAILCGFMPLFRPEGVFIIALMIITLWIHRSEFGLRKVILLGAVMLFPGVAWGLFSQAYYGSVLPQSVIAKQHGLYPVGLIGSAILVADYVIHSLTLISVFPSARMLLVGVGGFMLVIMMRGNWPPWGSKALYVFSRNDFEPGMQFQEMELP